LVLHFSDIAEKFISTLILFAFSAYLIFPFHLNTLKQTHNNNEYVTHYGLLNVFRRMNEQRNGTVKNNP